MTAVDASRGLAGRALLEVETALGRKKAPWIIGVLTAVAVAWIMGSLDAHPWSYEEIAYLLQARIFASFQWAGPPRPFPEFFEQIHVFSAPKLVPRFYPGHAMLLAPGIWVGAPSLVVVAMAGLTGALLFSLSRRLTNVWVALLAWCVWITAPFETTYLPTYLSGVTMQLIWLVAWWILLRWSVNQKSEGWLFAFFALIGWAIITSPRSAFALLIPTVAWLATRVGRRQVVRQLAPAAAVAIPIVLLLSIWSMSSLGSLYPTPNSAYAEAHAPWELPGFEIDSIAPPRYTIAGVQKLQDEYLPAVEAHSLRKLPMLVIDRLLGTVNQFYGSWRWLLLPFGIFGFFRLPRLAWLTIASSVLLILAHLPIVLRPGWWVAHMEVAGPLAFVTALGLYRAAARAVPYLEKAIPKLRSPGPLLGIAGLLGLFAIYRALDNSRDELHDRRAVRTRLAFLADSIPGKAVVFIRRRSGGTNYDNYVENPPEFTNARVWLADDHGSNNFRLLLAAPNRKAYIFDPGTGTVASWNWGALPSAE